MTITMAIKHTAIGPCISNRDPDPMYDKIDDVLPEPCACYHCHHANVCFRMRRMLWTRCWGVVTFECNDIMMSDHEQKILFYKEKL